MEMTSLMNFDHFSFLVWFHVLSWPDTVTMTLPVHLFKPLGGSKFLVNTSHAVFGIYALAWHIEYAEGIKVRFKSGQRIAVMHLTAILHTILYVENST